MAFAVRLRSRDSVSRVGGDAGADAVRFRFRSPPLDDESLASSVSVAVPGGGDSVDLVSDLGLFACSTFTREAIANPPELPESAGRSKRNWLRSSSLSGVLQRVFMALTYCLLEG